MDKEVKYLKITEWIHRSIEEGSLKPGDKLLSENELTELFQVSRQTVRRAVGELEAEGLLRRIRGSGTYLREVFPMDHTGSDPGRRTRIAVVTTYVDSYIFPKTIRGIESFFSDKGYTVQISFTNNQPERERAILQDIINSDDTGGLILEPTRSGLPSPNLDLLQNLKEKGIPVLFINSYYPGLSIPHVALDDRLAGVLVTRYLAAAGHRRIGTLMKFDDGQGHLRYAGYLDGCAEQGISWAQGRSVWIDTDGERHFEEYRDRILRSFKDCTAIFCYNDLIAVRLVKLLKAEGIRVPEDMSVISIDDSDLAGLCETPLTSVHHPTDGLGKLAAQNLYHLMHNRSFDGTEDMEPRIVERESVRAIS